METTRIVNLTFDTSCVISLLGTDNTPEIEFNALVELNDLFEKGLVKIWISEKSRTESQLALEKANLSENIDFDRIEKWKNALESFYHFGTTEGRWIIGVSRIGIDTVLGSSDEAATYEEINNIVMPYTPKGERYLGHIFDTAILFEHIITDNDVFVTRDKLLLRASVRERLEQRFQTNICNPVEALIEVKRNL